MKISFLTLVFILFSCYFLSAQTQDKHRVIVLTDIEADPDDTQSLIRLLLYSNEIDIKGLVATTSIWHKDQVNPESIEEIIEAYGEVHGNLLQHDKNFPDASKLSPLIKQGLPEYGMLGVGDTKNSEGSDWIVQELEKADSRPLWISVWGGVNTLAQTLYKIRKEKSLPEQNRLISKLRVYTISDQDDSGIWIRKNFPNLFYIVSPGDDYGSATWNAINDSIKGIDNEKISNTWIAENIQQNHGALGAKYPDVSWGVEGDTPAFLSLIPNGLNSPDHPDWGGWGGRYAHHKPDLSKQRKGIALVPFEQETRKIWTDTVDHYTPYIFSNYGRAVAKDSITFKGGRVSLWRWRDDFQNDFAARMDWCIMSFKEANHPPVPVLSGSDRITVKSGEKFRIDASPSNDPDGDSLSFLWFPYLEASNYSGEFELPEPENAHSVWATAPEVDKTESLHIILKVTDKGSPSLSRYKRIIVSILPK